MAQQLNRQSKDKHFIPNALPNIQSLVNEMADRIESTTEVAKQQTMMRLLAQRLRTCYQERYAFAHASWKKSVRWPVQHVRQPIDVVDFAGDSYQNHSPALEDIFERQLEAKGVTTPVRSVLLTGRAGTGKTALTHKLAYLWATGQWNKDKFEGVYVLPVAKLHQARYTGSSLNTQENLATAIARESCGGEALEDKVFAQLTQAIAYQLQHCPEKVLFIVDGWENRPKASAKIMAELEQYASRTYQLRTVRSDDRLSEEWKSLMAGSHDLVVACQAMTHLARNSYVAHYFQGERARAGGALLKFLEQRSTLSRLSLIPAPLQLICALWEKDAEAVKQIRRGSLAGLYHLLVQRVLTECFDKQATRVEATQKAGQLLEHLALKQFSNGQVWDINKNVLSILLQKDEAYRTCLNLLLQEGSLLQQTAAGEVSFSHPGLQSYFVGCALARMFLLPQRSLALVNFLQADKSCQHCEDVFPVMAQQVYAQAGAKGLEQLLATLVKNTGQEATDLQPLLLQLRCINECIGYFHDEDLSALHKLCKPLIDALHSWAQRSLISIHSSQEAPHSAHEILLHAFERLEHVVAASRLFVYYAKELKKPYKGTKFAALRALEVLAAVFPPCAKAALGLFTKLSKEARLPLRKQAVIALGAVAGSLPGEAPKILSSLLQLLQCHSAEMDYPISQAFLKLVAAVPTQAVAMQTALLRMSRDDNEVVSLQAGKILADLMEAAPSDGIYRILLGSCSSKDARLHMAALRALGGLVSVKPHYAQQVAKLALVSIQDKEYDVRLSGLETLEKCLLVALPVRTLPTSSAAKPQLIPLALIEEIWLTLLSVSKEQHFDLRDFAKGVLQTLARRMPPQLTNKVLPSVMTMVQGRRRTETRMLAISLLSALATANPVPTIARVLPKIIATYNSSVNEIRASSIRSVAALLKIDTAYVLPQAWPTLCKAICDEVSEVQLLAITALRTAATSAFEVQFFPIIKMLLEKAACTAKPEICVEAMQALAVCTQVMDKHASMFLEVLLKACKNNNEQVRSTAIRTLGVLSGRFTECLPTALPALKHACQDHVLTIRLLALSAVEKLTAKVCQQSSAKKEVQAPYRALSSVPTTTPKALQQDEKTVPPPPAPESAEAFAESVYRE